MAYISKVTRECNWSVCTTEASYEVRNNRNEVMGIFCHDHARKRKAEVEAMERREQERTE